MKINLIIIMLFAVLFIVSGLRIISIGVNGVRKKQLTTIGYHWPYTVRKLSGEKAKSKGLYYVLEGAIILVMGIFLALLVLYKNGK